MMIKASVTKEETNTLNFIKIKNISISKNINKTVKLQPRK